MRTKLIVVMIVCVFVAAYLFFKSQAGHDDATGVIVDVPNMESTTETLSTKTESVDWQPPALTADTYESEYGPLPTSLKGTRIPFDLRVDEQNHLIISASLRRLFDYFFTLVGEEDVETIKQRIEEILNKHLPDPARLEALDIFRQYIELKEGEIALRDQMAANFEATGEQVDLQERVRLLRELRQSLLSPEVYDAFFGEEDRRAEYSLDRHAILQDETLTLEERNAALRELDRQLPEHIRQAKEEEYVAEELSEKIQQARQQGATEAEIFQMRSEAYGVEAAERFAEADKVQSEWDTRVQRYRQERELVLNSTLTAEDKAAEIERLREQHFSGPELLRIPVIDRMYDQQENP